MRFAGEGGVCEGAFVADGSEFFSRFNARKHSKVFSVWIGQLNRIKRAAIGRNDKRTGKRTDGKSIAVPAARTSKMES